MKLNLISSLALAVLMSFISSCDEPAYRDVSREHKAIDTASYFYRGETNVDKTSRSTAANQKRVAKKAVSLESLDNLYDETEVVPQKNRSKKFKDGSSTIYPSVSDVNAVSLGPNGFETDDERLMRQSEEGNRRMRQELLEIQSWSQREAFADSTIVGPELETGRSEVPASTYRSSNTYNGSAIGPGTGANPNVVPVSGYYRSNGTYVKPYIRTARNSTTLDNFSIAPNYNPYTGHTGSRKH